MDRPEESAAGGPDRRGIRRRSTDTSWRRAARHGCAPHDATRATSRDSRPTPNNRQATASNARRLTTVRLSNRSNTVDRHLKSIEHTPIQPCFFVTPPRCGRSVGQMPAGSTIDSPLDYLTPQQGTSSATTWTTLRPPRGPAPPSRKILRLTKWRVRGFVGAVFQLVVTLRTTCPPQDSRQGHGAISPPTAPPSAPNDTRGRGGRRGNRNSF